MNVGTYEKALKTISDQWPDGEPWPRDVARYGHWIVSDGGAGEAVAKGPAGAEVAMNASHDAAARRPAHPERVSQFRRSA